MSRMDQYDVTVTITKGNDVKNTGTWDKMEGGEIDSSETKFRPGKMGAQISLGGYREVGNITVSRLYDLTRDHANLASFLIGAVGKAVVDISKQPLDVDGNKSGKPIVYSGRLKAVTFPEHDSESSDAAMVSIEVSTGSSVSVAA